MKRISLYCTLGIMLLLLGFSCAWAQTVTGSITGQVTDPSGAVVAGATVTATNVATGVKTTAQTNGSGVYNIRFLPVGTYKLTIESAGFTPTSVAPFSLDVNQTAKIDSVMKIGSSTTVVVQKLGLRPPSLYKKMFTQFWIRPTPHLVIPSPRTKSLPSRSMAVTFRL
ncbi:MAG TPA: carboxypeptidase-like regulatory domain-containing protein [Candidatus Sulfotelmatobacter sp.]|nr:carboxypeptidase-like regulatory domain-containing protein [Candidatus Sulfotelmatobacter sp.]